MYLDDVSDQAHEVGERPTLSGYDKLTRVVCKAKFFPGKIRVVGQFPMKSLHHEVGERPEIFKNFTMEVHE